MRRWLPVVCVLSLGVAQAPAQAAPQATVIRGVRYEFSPSVKGDPARYYQAVNTAVDAAIVRFRNWGFSVARRDVVDSVRVFGDPDGYRVAFASHFRMPIARVPDSLQPFIDGKLLLLPTLGVHHTASVGISGEDNWSEDVYRDELARQANMRLHEVAVGGSKSMGPTWFAEGMSYYGTDQFSEQLPYSRAECQRCLDVEQKGEVSHHRSYMRMVKALAQRVPMGELIRHAADPGFPLPYLSRLK